MTDTICETRADALPEAVDGSLWQMRLKALGISQADMAEAVGMTPTNLSTGLRSEGEGIGWASGVPQHLKALIIALEAMTGAQRERWLADAKTERALWLAELKRRERGKVDR